MYLKAMESTISSQKISIIKKMMMATKSEPPAKEMENE